jgi:DNA-binding FadR family transcriptional regulator
MLLEPYAAARVAEAASREELRSLERFLADCERALAQGEDIRPRNLEFHRRLLRLAGNPVLAAVGETVLRILSERIAHLSSPQTSKTVLRMHREMAAALAAREAEKAKSIMAKDIRAVGKRLAQISKHTKRGA